MSLEVQELGLHDYQPVTQSEDGGHLHAGRLLMTGGFSFLAGKGGIRSDGRVTVTYKRAGTLAAGQPADGPIEQIRKLSELRDAGILTDGEFAAKKADLLSRM
ncbi:MAG: SHOCT domain-containing protein [Chloroflexota bacterium]